MKRRLFKLALFLFLGAVVNVAVAWGCAVWSLSGGQGGLAGTVSQHHADFYKLYGDMCAVLKEWEKTAD